MKTRLILSSIALFAIMISFALSSQYSSADTSLKPNQVYYNVFLTGNGNTNASVTLRNNDTQQVWSFGNNGNGSYTMAIPSEVNASSYSIYVCNSKAGSGVSHTFVYDGYGTENFYLTMQAGCPVPPPGS